MTEFLHILERAGIHYASSAMLVLLVFFALRHWQKRNWKVRLWVPYESRHLLVFSALLVFALSALREPYDVWAGQSLLKAFADFFSWFAGCATSAWGLYRFYKDA